MISKLSLNNEDIQTFEQFCQDLKVKYKIPQQLQLQIDVIETLQNDEIEILMKIPIQINLISDDQQEVIDSDLLYTIQQLKSQICKLIGKQKYQIEFSDRNFINSPDETQLYNLQFYPPYNLKYSAKIKIKFKLRNNIKQLDFGLFQSFKDIKLFIEEQQEEFTNQIQFVMNYNNLEIRGELLNDTPFSLQMNNFDTITLIPINMLQLFIKFEHNDKKQLYQIKNIQICNLINELYYQEQISKGFNLKLYYQQPNGQLNELNNEKYIFDYPFNEYDCIIAKLDQYQQISILLKDIDYNEQQFLKISSNKNIKDLIPNNVEQFKIIKENLVSDQLKVIEYRVEQYKSDFKNYYNEQNQESTWIDFINITFINQDNNYAENVKVNKNDIIEKELKAVIKRQGQQIIDNSHIIAISKGEWIQDIKKTYYELKIFNNSIISYHIPIIKIDYQIDEQNQNFCFIDEKTTFIELESQLIMKEDIETEQFNFTSNGNKIENMQRIVYDNYQSDQLFKFQKSVEKIMKKLYFTCVGISDVQNIDLEFEQTQNVSDIIKYFKSKYPLKQNQVLTCFYQNKELSDQFIISNIPSEPNARLILTCVTKIKIRLKEKISEQKQVRNFNYDSKFQEISNYLSERNQVALYYNHNCIYPEQTFKDQNVQDNDIIIYKILDQESIFVEITQNNFNIYSGWRQINETILDLKQNLKQQELINIENSQLYSNNRNLDDLDELNTLRSGQENFIKIEIINN